MSRPLKYRLIYVGAVAIILAVSAVVAHGVFPDAPMAVLLTVAILLFIPGRIEGLFYSDLLRGRRLFADGKWQAALDHFAAFHAQINQHPWRKRLFWLTGTIFSPNLEATTLNYLGATLVELERFDEATDKFRAAIKLDPKFALPHFNLAVIEAVANHETRAAARLAKARELGHPNSTVDNLIDHAQALLARIESHSRPNDGQAPPPPPSKPVTT